MKKSTNFSLRLWVVIGLLGYLALPWYAMQDGAWYQALPGVLGGADTANGLVQAVIHKRKWLLIGLAGLVMAAAGVGMPAGRQQGGWLLAGGLVGSLGLAASGFLIGAKGWAFAALNTQFGELA
ncbi:MAG: iron ABC transporter permease, partial [Burkholderiaceae bacterium]|nr:iron ABC transporter permease [Burkholderiaceae bacterium]